MKKIRSLAVLLIAIVLMLSFTTVAYAYGGEPPEATTTPSPTLTVTASPTATAAPTATSQPNPFTPSGTGTVVNTATDADGKQFYTITTPDKNVFYLVIDLQRETDNVYFLNAVTEQDLLALAEKSGDTSGTGATTKANSASVASTPAPAASAGTTTSSEPDISAKSSSSPQGNNMVTLLLVLAVVVIGGGAGYYFKVYRPKKQRAESEEEADYTPEESAYDAEEADELPPWEDEDNGDDQA